MITSIALANRESLLYNPYSRLFYDHNCEVFVLRIRRWKDKLFTVALLLVCLGVFWLFRLPCPFQHFLHIPCFGCGMTRAYLCLLRLDIAGAFAMHAMFWSVPLLGLYYIFDWRLLKNKWADNVVLTLLCLGFVINWIVHLLWGNCRARDCCKIAFMKKLNNIAGEITIDRDFSRYF